MIYQKSYDSPIGALVITVDEDGLRGLWFGSETISGELKYRSNYETALDEASKAEGLSADIRKTFEDTFRWLDLYFEGQNPNFTPKLHLIGSEFRCSVWELLLKIPYGETTTYGELAEEIAKRKGIKRMSAQAIGGAVGHNEISLIVPCHRVIGKDGSLTGYAGGLDKKEFLLKLEGISYKK